MQVLLYKNGRVEGQVKQLVEVEEQVRQLALQARQVSTELTVAEYNPEGQVV